MGRRRRWMPPFEAEITHLGPKGVGEGVAPDGKPVRIRGAAPGTRVRARVTGKKKGVWLARTEGTVRPASGGVTPRCPVFGLCGGCTLQELSPEAQRHHKHAMAVRDVAAGLDLTAESLEQRIRVHPPRVGSKPWGYRNKVELSFGVRRYLSESDHSQGLPIDGRFLGFHAPGRFDRVVDTDRCALIDDSMNALLSAVRDHTLIDSAPPPWCTRAHTGFWRHLVLRSGQATGERMVILITASPTEFPGVEQSIGTLATSLMNLTLPDGARVVGVQWRTNDAVSDVAQGQVRQTWGAPSWQEQLGPIRYTLEPEAFFQTSTEGATALYDTVSEALGPRGGTLLDLYCGVGSIGLYLADGFDRVVGVEEVAPAIEAARANAQANDVEGEWSVARVEDALQVLEQIPHAHIVVDPPRAGLHPKVARALAATDASSLVYVACKPASLGRDAALMAAGWELKELWTVDLFPHTPHIEAVARFERSKA